jgi:NitT/TauT family transport system ATP-binding protein
MMQRVGIARALVFNPDLLLMDQPFGALDAITRRKLRYDFLKIFERAAKTIIIVTNSIDEALLFANRIYVMSEAPGTIEEVVEVTVPFEERHNRYCRKRTLHRFTHADD